MSGSGMVVVVASQWFGGEWEEGGVNLGLHAWLRGNRHTALTPVLHGRQGVLKTGSVLRGRYAREDLRGEGRLGSRDGRIHLPYP